MPRSLSQRWNRRSWYGSKEVNYREGTANLKSASFESLAARIAFTARIASLVESTARPAEAFPWWLSTL